MLGGLSDSLVGAANCEIQRADPSIRIDQFKLEPGKSTVLIGSNGAGKSTLLDAIMQRLNADFHTKEGAGAVVYGEPFHEREPLRIARLDQEEILQRIGHLKTQDVIDQTTEYFKKQFPEDWDNIDWDNVDAAAKAQATNEANMETTQRIDELTSRMIKFFEMEEFLDRDVSDLSGGERTKLVLFTVLASEPDVLLLDEPTNHLDMESIAKLTGLFEKYKKAGASVISASHVDWFLRDVGNDGVVEIQTEDIERKLIESKSPYIKYIKSREGKSVISEPISWEKSPARKTGQTLISTTESVNIPDSPLNEVNLPSTQSGETIILSGKNGTGKSCLMEAMKKIRKSEGITKEKGTNLAYMPQFWPDEVAQGSLEDFFHWVKQESNPNSDTTSKQYINLLRKSDFGSNNEVIRIDESLLKRSLSSFSGGEQRLLWFLATSSIPNIDVMLLDEPTNHMDRNLQKVITKAIQDFPGAVVIASHDVNLIETLTEDVGNKSVKTPKHLVLEKKQSRTTISLSQENPSEYAKRVREKASKEAKRFKI